MKLTREQAVEEHRKMWRWIADETRHEKRRVEKEEYFENTILTKIPICKCYCCEYAVSVFF